MSANSQCKNHLKSHEGVKWNALPYIFDLKPAFYFLKEIIPKTIL